eukprot:7391754-Prymnesium_polylepis.1
MDPRHSGFKAHTHASCISINNAAHCATPLVWCGRLRGSKLTWIEPPAVHCAVGARVPLRGQQHEPLLARRLLELWVRIPCPEHRAAWQDRPGARAALIRQAVGDAHDAARGPDVVRLLRVLVVVAPQHLEPLTDERLVEGRRRLRLPRLDVIGDARLDAPLHLRLRLGLELLAAEACRRADRLRVRVQRAELRRAAPFALRRRSLSRQPAQRARLEAPACDLLVDDLLQQLRQMRDARRVLGPAEAQHAHLDLAPQVLELLRLGLGPALVIVERLLDRRLRARPLALRLRPRVEELLRVRVLLDRLNEQRLDALLAPRQLLRRLRPEVGAMRLARSVRLEPRVHDKRLLQLGREARVKEAADVRRPLVHALPPVAEDGGRRVEVVVPHLLSHARDGVDTRVAEHAHQQVDATEVRLDAVVGGVRALGRLVARRINAARERAALAGEEPADGAARVSHGGERRSRHLLSELDRARRRLRVAAVGVGGAARLAEDALVDEAGRAVGRLARALHVLLAPGGELRVLGGERRERVEVRVKQQTAVGGDLLHHLQRDVAQLGRVVEAHAELAALARQPAERLGEDVHEQCVDAQRRRHLIAAEHRKEELLELVARARHHEALDELEDLLATGEDRRGAVEAEVLPAALRAQQPR